MAIRVLVVDDHELFAEAVSSLLMDAGMEVVGSLPSGAAAIPFLEEHGADVIVLDLGLREESGLVIGKRILDRWPEMRIIAFSAFEDERAAHEANQIGFHAFVTKDTPSNDFVRIVRAIGRGAPVPLLLSSLDERLDLTGRLYKLTARERDVLRLLAEGLNGRTIGDRLNMTQTDVRGDIQSLCEKLGARGRLEAITRAISEAPDPSTDHPHLTRMTDDQILAHLRFMHARGIAPLSPVDFDNMRELHRQLHRQVPPSPA